MKGTERQKKVFFAVFAMILIILLEGWLVWQFRLSPSKEIVKDTRNDIAALDQCELQGKRFVNTGEDPKIVWNTTDRPVSKLTLHFAEPLSADTGLEIYYGKDYAFDEHHAYYAVLSKGITSYSIRLQGGEYNSFRTDINGEHTLDQIEIVEKETVPGRVCAGILLCLLVDGVVICLYRRWKKSPEKHKKRVLTIPQLFVVWGILGGITASVLIPTGQVPDDWTHVALMDMEWGLNGYAGDAAAKLNNVLKVDSIHNMFGQKITLQDYKKAAGIHYDDSLKLSIHPNYLAVRHITAGIGYIIGILLHLPIIWCLQLAKMTALAGYLVCGYLALKWIPYKKELMMVIMLFPMCLQQAASFNYDSVVQGAGFLLIAYLLWLREEKEKITWGNLVFAVILTIVLMVTKLPYACLILLAFSVPHEKYDFRIGKVDVGAVCYRWRYMLLAVSVVLAGVVTAVVKNNINFNIMKAAVIEWPATLRLITNSLKIRGTWYAAGIVGNLGWLDTPLLNIHYLAIVLVILWLSQAGKPSGERDHKDWKQKLSNRTAMLLIALLIFLMIFISMIYYETSLSGQELPVGLSQWRQIITGAGNILGVQGRYFLPCLPIAVLAFRDIVPLPSRGVRTGVAIYCLFNWGCLVTALLARYWVIM